MPKAIVYSLFGKIKVEYLFDQMTLSMLSIRMLNIKKRKHKNLQEFFFFFKNLHFLWFSALLEYFNLIYKNFSHDVSHLIAYTNWKIWVLIIIILLYHDLSYLSIMSPCPILQEWKWTGVESTWHRVWWYEVQVPALLLLAWWPSLSFSPPAYWSITWS